MQAHFVFTFGVELGSRLRSFRTGLLIAIECLVARFRVVWDVVKGVGLSLTLQGMSPLCSLNALCPQNHCDNRNSPHKFPELPLGGSTFSTEDHCSNRTEALDGLINGLWGECLQIRLVGLVERERGKLWP